MCTLNKLLMTASSKPAAADVLLQLKPNGASQLTEDLGGDSSIYLRSHSSSILSQDSWADTPIHWFPWSKTRTAKPQQTPHHKSCYQGLQAVVQPSLGTHSNQAASSTIGSSLAHMCLPVQDNSQSSTPAVALVAAVAASPAAPSASSAKTAGLQGSRQLTSSSSNSVEDVQLQQAAQQHHSSKTAHAPTLVALQRILCCAAQLVRLFLLVVMQHRDLLHGGAQSQQEATCSPMQGCRMCCYPIAVTTSVHLGFTVIVHNIITYLLLCNMLLVFLRQGAHRTVEA